MPIDFSQLSWEDFEFFCRDLIESYNIQILDGPARGPDRNKDLLIQYKVKDVIGREEQVKVLVQCKHNAKSKKSVYESDLKDIRSACKIHNAKGYLLITSTIPSVSVQNILNAIDEEGYYFTHYWDKYLLEKFISKSRQRQIILDRYDLTQIENKIFQYSIVDPSEYELLQYFGRFEVLKDFISVLYTPNSLYIYRAHVISLNISEEDCPIYDLESVLEQLNVFQRLERLIITGISLKKFPASILKLKNLDTLYLNDNDIYHIPKELSKLKKLARLDISYNPLRLFSLDVKFFKQLRLLIDPTQKVIIEKSFKLPIFKNYSWGDFHIWTGRDRDNHDILQSFMYKSKNLKNPGL